MRTLNLFFAMYGEFISKKILPVACVASGICCFASWATGIEWIFDIALVILIALVLLTIMEIAILCDIRRRKRND